MTKFALATLNKRELADITKKFTHVAVVIIMVMAVSEIIGLSLDLQWLIDGNVHHMAIITAISFVFISLALLFLLNGKMLRARTLAIIVITFALISAWVNNFLFDQERDLAIRIIEILNFNSHIGMVSTTAFFLTLCSTGIIFISYAKKHTICLQLANAIGAFVLGFLIIYFIANILGIGERYLWHDEEPMVINTIIAFIIASLGIMSLTWHKGIDQNTDVWKYMWFCVLITLVVATLTIAKETSEELEGKTNTLVFVILAIGLFWSVIFAILFYLLRASLISTLQLRNSTSLLRATLDATADGVMAINLQGDIILYNKVMSKMLNISESQMSEFNRDKLIQFINIMVQNKVEVFEKMQLGQAFPLTELNQMIMLNDGSVYEVYGKPQLLDSTPVGRVWSFRNVTLQKKLEEKIGQLKNYDLLTGLPNRNLIIQEINNKIKSNREGMIGFILININKFSNINDEFGRVIGDDILKWLAKKIQGLLNKQDKLARISGDVFLLVHYNATQKNIQVIMDNIVKEIKAPVDFFGININLQLFMGVSIWPADASTAEDLISTADIAMLDAKEHGLDNQFYSSNIHLSQRVNVKLEKDLQKAVEFNQLVVHYQPIIDLKTHQVTIIEALVRWKHPEYGIIYPKDFIYLAEKTDVINDISIFVMHSGSKFLQRLNMLGFNVKLAINISAKQLHSYKLFAEIDDLIKNHEISGEQLEIELTENVLLENSETIKNEIQAIKNRKISIAIDDFGVGYSALSYLKNFNVDKLKIDYSFVKNCVDSKSDRALIRAIIEMGKSMGLTLLAEGIETVQQLEIIEELGCDLGQGFYFAKPLPIDECLKYITELNAKTG